MNKKSIPETMKKQVDEIVERFNKKVLKDPDYYYLTRYRGTYLYLDRFDYGRVGPIWRLKYGGKIDNWEFAIYKYSDERYDADDLLIPGLEYIDGTEEGAMKAGLEAYP